MIELRNEQKAAIARVVSEPTRAALIAADTGAGKTFIAVEIAKALAAKTVLVIAPLNTFDGWTTAIAERELDLTVCPITATDDAAYYALKAGTPGMYLVGREFFHLSATALDSKPREDKSKPKVPGPNGKLVYPPLCDDEGNVLMTPGRKARWSWGSVRPDLVIYDEVQATQNRWSAGHRVLKTLRPGFKIAMSATPGRNTFKGIWAPCRWLWPNDRDDKGALYVDNSQWRWAAQWAIIAADPHTGSGKKITDERHPGAFVASLPCYIRFEVEKTPVETLKVRITLTPAQRAMYDAMKADSLAWLGDHPLVADLPIVQKTRLRQIGLGELTLDENGEVNFAPDCNSAKADACLKIIARHPGEHVLFLTDSARFAKVLAARLPDTALWSGEVNAATRDAIKAAFIAGEIRYIVATIQSIGEGVNMLQYVCRVEVWLNKSFDETLNIQAEGRLNRMGQMADKIVSYELYASETDDVLDADRLRLTGAAMRDSLRARI